MRRWPLSIVPDGEQFLVTAPDWPELTTHGSTVSECLENGKNALDEAIMARIDHRERIPFASHGDVWVSPSEDVLGELDKYEEAKGWRM